MTEMTVKCRVPRHRGFSQGFRRVGRVGEDVGVDVGVVECRLKGVEVADCPTTVHSAWDPPHTDASTLPGTSTKDRKCLVPVEPFDDRDDNENDDKDAAAAAADDDDDDEDDENIDTEQRVSQLVADSLRPGGSEFET